MRTRPWHRIAWIAVNASTVPFWLAMILAPRSDLTRRLVEAVTPLYATLGVAYTALLVSGAARSGEPPDFSGPESVFRALGVPETMLAAWTHYLVFDLFVGRWIYETALEEGRPARLSLLLTWWAGPMGLTLFLARRRVRAAVL